MRTLNLGAFSGGSGGGGGGNPLFNLQSIFNPKATEQRRASISQLSPVQASQILSQNRFATNNGGGTSSSAQQIATLARSLGLSGFEIQQLLSKGLSRPTGLVQEVPRAAPTIPSLPIQSLFSGFPTNPPPPPTIPPKTPPPTPRPTPQPTTHRPTTTKPTTPKPTTPTTTTRAPDPEASFESAFEAFLAQRNVQVSEEERKELAEELSKALLSSSVLRKLTEEEPKNEDTTVELPPKPTTAAPQDRTARPSVTFNRISSTQRLLNRIPEEVPRNIPARIHIPTRPLIASARAVLTPVTTTEPPGPANYEELGDPDFEDYNEEELDNIFQLAGITPRSPEPRSERRSRLLSRAKSPFHPQQPRAQNRFLQPPEEPIAHPLHLPGFSDVKALQTPFLNTANIDTEALRRLEQEGSLGKLVDALESGVIPLDSELSQKFASVLEWQNPSTTPKPSGGEYPLQTAQPLTKEEHARLIAKWRNQLAERTRTRRVPDQTTPLPPPMPLDSSPVDRAVAWVDNQRTANEVFLRTRKLERQLNNGGEFQDLSPFTVSPPVSRIRDMARGKGELGLSALSPQDRNSLVREYYSSLREQTREREKKNSAIRARIMGNLITTTIVPPLQQSALIQPILERLADERKQIGEMQKLQALFQQHFLAKMPMVENRTEAESALNEFIRVVKHQRDEKTTTQAPFHQPTAPPVVSFQRNGASGTPISRSQISPTTPPPSDAQDSRKERISAFLAAIRNRKNSPSIETTKQPIPGEEKSVEARQERISNILSALRSRQELDGGNLAENINAAIQTRKREQSLAEKISQIRTALTKMREKKEALPPKSNRISLFRNPGDGTLRSLPQN